MVKKIEPLTSWISCSQATLLLSEKLGFPIESRYIRQLAKRKKKPVRTKTLGYHQLYNRQDLEQVTIKKRGNSTNLREVSSRADAI